MRKRLRKGMEVAVVFDDHVEDFAQPLLFIVYGRLVEVQRKYLVIESWTYADIKVTRDSNVKFWTVLRSAIRNCYELRREEI